MTWLLVAGMACAQGVIEGGVGVGPYRVGGSFDSVKARLGAPTRTVQSERSSKTHLYYYKRQGIFFYTDGDRITDIAVESPIWTMGSIRPGSSTRDDVIRRLGKPQSLHSNEEAYPEQGLMFTYDQQDHIQQIYVMDKEARDALAGDLSVQAGQRIGGISVGMTLDRILLAWGSPSDSAPWSVDPRSMLMYYKTKGILIIAGADKTVQGVTTESPAFGTPEGLRVGSSRSDVYRVYGPNPQRVGGIEMYKRVGIGFTIDKDKVTEITVLPRSR
jgi:hypothetical protein